MEIFSKNKNYSFDDMVSICDKNKLVTVDCLKEENMVSVEAYNNGELGDCIFEFKRSGNDLFKLSYIDEINLEGFKRDNVSDQG